VDYLDFLCTILFAIIILLFYLMLFNFCELSLCDKGHSTRELYLSLMKCNKQVRNFFPKSYEKAIFIWIFNIGYLIVGSLCCYPLILAGRVLMHIIGWLLECFINELYQLTSILINTQLMDYDLNFTL